MIPAGSSFYSGEELAGLGLKSFGHAVKISRRASLYNTERIEIGSHVRIDDFCVISACTDGWVRIGSHCYVGAMGFIEATSGFEMEDFATLAARVTVYGGSDDYSGEYLANPCVPCRFRNVVSGRVTLGVHSIVGTCSVILPGVTVGRGSAVGACSLVTGSLAPGGIYVGSPARFLKKRSARLFELEGDARLEME